MGRFGTGVPFCPIYMRRFGTSVLFRPLWYGAFRYICTFAPKLYGAFRYIGTFLPQVERGVLVQAFLEPSRYFFRPFWDGHVPFCPIDMWQVKRDSWFLKIDSPICKFDMGFSGSSLSFSIENFSKKKKGGAYGVRDRGSSDLMSVTLQKT